MVEELLQGALLLKHEKKGFSLRWVSVDRKKRFIYWVNPDEDALQIEKDNFIEIKKIEKVVVNNNVITSEMEKNQSPLSVSFSIHSEGRNVGFSVLSRRFIIIFYFYFFFY
jgi:hypothetical protein